MKKILSILLIFDLSLGFSQTTTRFGTAKNTDNTGRILTYAVISTSDVTSATIDTINVIPNAWETIWVPRVGGLNTGAIVNLSDSCVVKFSSTTTNYRIGDSFSLFLSKGTGNGRIRFGGSQFITTTTASTGVALAANKSMYMRFRWSGSKWVEVSRTVQP